MSINNKMIGPILLNYLYKNYSNYICTPLSNLMYQLIHFIWENKNPELMSKLNSNQKKLIISMVYGPNFEELFEKIKFKDENEKEFMYNFLLDARKDFKINDTSLKDKKNIYDDELFIYILKNVIKMSLKKELDEIEKEMIKYDNMLKLSKLNNDIIHIFHYYYDYVIREMIELEKYIDGQKVKFIESYRNMIYNEKYNKEELKNYFEDKINLFDDKINSELTKIKQKFNTYLYILKRWIEISNKDEQFFKIYISNELFEEINIFQDICSLGDLYLIELAAPIINKLSFSEQKNIIQKMSSGVKNRTNHLFSFNKNFENFFHEVWNDDRVAHIKYNLNTTDKNIFEKQLKVITTTMNDIMERFT